MSPQEEAMAPLCPHHEKLAADVAETKDCVHRIETRQTRGDVKLGQHGVQIGLLMKIVFGAVGLILTGFLVAAAAQVWTG